MKKVLFLFYNAGAGIHVANSMIEDAVKSLPFELEFKKIFSSYSNSSYYLPLIEQYKPDIIVMQDFFPGLIEAAVGYKKNDNLSCKVLLFSFTDYPASENEAALIKEIDKVYLPNRAGIKGPDWTEIFNPPLSLTKFYNYKNWNGRDKTFCSIGRLIKTKCTNNLIHELDKTRAGYDYYASGSYADEGYDQERDEALRKEQGDLSTAFYTSKTCKLYPPLTRGKICRTLNKYKYHVLLAEDDCFSIITLEAFASGTIPILICSNERRSELLSWIPKGFGLHYENIYDFIADVSNLEKKDYSEKARKESLYIRSVYNQADFYARVYKYFI